MAPHTLCALCGLFLAAAINFYGVSAQKSEWSCFFPFFFQGKYFVWLWVNVTYVFGSCLCLFVIYPLIQKIYLCADVQRNRTRLQLCSCSAATFLNSCASHRFRIPTALFQPVSPSVRSSVDRSVTRVTSTDSSAKGAFAHKSVKKMKSGGSGGCSTCVQGRSL